MKSATPIADMIEQLFDAGVSPTTIVLAIRTIEERDAQRDASRSITMLSDNPEAIRARRYRQNLKQKQSFAKANDVANGGAQSVTGKRDAQRDAVTSPCIFSESVLSTEEAKKKDRTVVVEGRKRGTRLPADWQPSEVDQQFARAHKVDPVRLRNEFVDFWISVPGQRGTKLDWSATWRNRVRTIAGTTGKQNGQHNVIAAADRLVEKLHEFERDDDLLTGLRSGAGAPDVRMLPTK